MRQCDVVTGVIGRRSRQENHLRAIAITSTMQGFCHVRVLYLHSTGGFSTSSDGLKKETTDVVMRY
ncbi:unnamed protein product [Fusarium graminearum]|uniref:Chromosome 1, complete genome n=1 Tax=Gibberella zeae (strain ATCC MYA-4620 / CBS 123657 / FGSC 9075 / NRRL 31084 / PH-1) TaxID=229533 RepID=A0A098D1G9_GIBZE|nr:unnamed protein product [Fusarium graminearum]CZS76055.1 unnamed protein product [Fusarium graminearum]